MTESLSKWLDKSPKSTVFCFLRCQWYFCKLYGLKRIMCRNKWSSNVDFILRVIILLRYIYNFQCKIICPSGTSSPDSFTINTIDNNRLSYSYHTRSFLDCPLQIVRCYFGLSNKYCCTPYIKNRSKTSYLYSQ